MQRMRYQINIGCPKKVPFVVSGTIDGAAPIKFCSFFLTLIEEKGTINVLGSIETHIKIV